MQWFEPVYTYAPKFASQVTAGALPCPTPSTMGGGKRVKCNANIKGMKKVAGALQEHEQAQMMQQVIEHMKAHPEDVRPLWRLCESGLVQTLSPEEFEPMVPSCSSNLKLVSLTLKKKVLMTPKPGIDSSLLRVLRTHDSNVVDTLFYFCLAEDPKTGVEASLSEADFIRQQVARHHVTGKRAGQLVFTEVGKVQWATCGVYRFCSPPEGEPEDDKDMCSWIEHRPSQLKAPLL